MTAAAAADPRVERYFATATRWRDELAALRAITAATPLVESSSGAGRSTAGTAPMSRG